MTIFYSSKIPNLSGYVTHAEWHSCLSILAVACKSSNGGSDLYIIAENKEPVKIRIPSEKQINLLRWHPLDKLLAIGWKTCGISIVDIAKSSIKNIENVAYDISSIHWSQRGFILFCAATNGHLSLWTLSDMASQPQQILVTTVDVSITSVVLIKNDCNFANNFKFGHSGYFIDSRVNSNSGSTLIDSAIFIGGCIDGRVLRIFGEVTALARNYETTTERVLTLTKCNAPVVKLLVDEKSRLLLVITEDNMLLEYKFNDDGGKSVTEILTLKLASKLSEEPSFSWAGDMTLAMALGEGVIRLWDIAKSDNYTLVPEINCSSDQRKSARILKLTYCSKFKLLAVGLSTGQIFVWKRTKSGRHQKSLNGCGSNGSDSEQRSLQSLGGSLTAESGSGIFDPETYWQAQPIIDLLKNHGDEHLRETGNIAIRLLSWNPFQGTMVAAYGALSERDNLDDYAAGEPENSFGVFFLEQQPLRASLGGCGSATFQTAPQRLTILTSDQSKLNRPRESDHLASVRATAGLRGAGSGATSSKNYSEPIAAIEYELIVEEQLRSCSCTKEHVAIWNGRQLRVFKHSLIDGVSPLSTFACEFKLVGMHDQSLFIQEPYRLQVRNLQGTVKQLINFGEMEGTLSLTSFCNGFMVCMTDTGLLKSFDVTQREVKQLSSTKQLNSVLTHFFPIPWRKSMGAVNHHPQPLVRVSRLSVNNAASLIALNLCFAYPSRTFSSSNQTAGQYPSEFFTSLREEDKAVSDFSSSISLSVEHHNWHPDTCIYIWQVELDRFQVFDFFTGECRPFEASNSSVFIPTVLCKNSTEPNPLCGSKASLSQTINEFGHGRYPVRHYWDIYDPRLLVIEAAELSIDHPAFKGAITPDSVGLIDDNFEGEALRPRSQVSGVSEAESRGSNLLKNSEKTSSSCCNNTMRNLVVSLFVSSDLQGVIIQEYFFMSLHHSALIGTEVPYFYFAVYPYFAQAQSQSQPPGVKDCQAPPTDKSETLTLADAEAGGDTMAKPQQHTMAPAASCGISRLMNLNRRVMRDFHGLESADSGTREAILNFSFFLAQGEMDAAFRSMKLIRSTSVWQNMAKMCVSTRRLDVGLVCLGKMGNAFGAMMVREVQKSEKDITVQTGELALQLGMTEEAERLFVECDRWDLVARLHRTLGHWEEVVQIAEKRNRLRLRNTHYAYAQELRNQGCIEDAIQHYIKSGTHFVEVPRMLKGSPDKLEEFVKAHPNRDLQCWWAQTLEAEGLLEEAEVYYALAKDYLSLVRVYCCLNREEAALELCNETGDKAACYHLARKFESKQNIDRAIHLFTRARAYSSAVKLCQENDRCDHLFSLAQLGTPEDMLEAARHLERRLGYEEKTILLYQRAGQLNTAIELAFQSRQYSALANITEEMEGNVDPSLLSKCAAFFMQNSQFDKAVELLASGKQWIEAIKLCGDYDVTLTEALVEKLTPPSETPGLDRTEVLTQLGYQCLSQGQYHLACKKLTQAGDRVSAMKALLRSGDTEKIVFFANVSKQRDIYIMAANYLQTLDVWRTDTEVIRLIVQFYTRGKALDSLASFYESCAQVEIVDYQNYEKAMGALTEAYKVLSKAAALSADNVEMSIDSRLQQKLLNTKMKIMLCKQFVETQMMFEDNPVEALSRCQALLEEPETAKIIRPGDIYATMIRELVAKERFKAAYACMQEMKKKVGGRDLASYMDKATQITILKALDMPDNVLGTNVGCVIDEINDQQTSDTESIEENVVNIGSDDGI